MKAFFLRFLPLFIALAVAGVGLFLGPTAQAVALETIREITPESATQQLRAWIELGTYAVTAFSALLSLGIGAFFRLRAQMRAQCARHDEAIKTVQDALSAPVASLLPAPVQTPAPGVASPPPAN